MNYDWSSLYDKGDYAHGFIEVYKAAIKGNTAIVSIKYLAQLGNEDNDKKVVTTVLLDGPKTDWTKTTLNSILYDAQDRIKATEDFKFRVFGKLDYMTVQIFHFPKIDNLELFTFGDFGFG